jgi:conjugal transfer pilus assembly protein TraF
MRKLLLALPGVILLSCLGAAHAQHTKSQFDRFEGDGYYWYKQDPEHEPPKKPVPPPPPKPAEPAKPPEPKPMSASWIRANMPKLLDAAIDNPTRENVANYMYAQRVILDKSQNFSDMAADVVSTDAYLDENNRVPIAEFAQASFILEQADNKKAVLKSLADKSGIWVFVDKPEKCRACANYVNDVVTSKIVGLQTAFGFNVRVIDVSTPEGATAAKRLDLKLTPTTVLVAPPASFYVVSQGLMAATTLQEKILVAARMNGMITEASIAKIQPYSKGLLNNEALNSAAADSDPTVVMSKFRAKLSGETK